ncbi:hypothetical protein [Yoonia sp. I 8.24]|uniref:hypothetical protein n=1 Tax=Yoonia sp. I 8.24 TaxID=1537229 RepID=UPI001EDEB4E5|nr:hypothetical protein [Yoonia sp. I 8.24]MCG3268698.1 hypothetical protein [Yoonia sp. I 8.24]
MLAVRSFFFSFSILWRLCLVAPFLVIILAVYGLIGVLFLSIITSIFPLVGIAVILAASFAISSSFPIMVGARLGFQAKYEPARYGYGRMFMFSLIYGFCEALVVMMIGGIAIGGVYASGVNFAMAADIESFFEGTAGAIVSLSTVFVISGLRSVMLVPMAGAALGRDSNGQPHTPFFEAGARGLSLWVIALLSMLLGPLILVAIGIFAGLADNEVLARFFESYDRSGFAHTRFSWEVVGVIAATCVVSLWTFSWQAAAGVLVYLDKRDAHNAEDVVVHSEDDRAAARDLWKDRMPPGRR